MGRSLTKISDVKHENDHVGLSNAIDTWSDALHEYRHNLKALHLGMRLILETNRKNENMKLRQLITVWARRAHKAFRKERIKDQKQKLRQSHFQMAGKRLYKFMTHDFNLKVSNFLRQWEKNIDLDELKGQYRRHPHSTSTTPTLHCRVSVMTSNEV